MFGRSRGLVTSVAAASSSSSEGGRTLLGSYTVSGAAANTIVIGTGGPAGLSTITFPAGKRYGIYLRAVFGSPTATNVITLDPNSQTSNLTNHVIYTISTTLGSQGPIADGLVYSTSADVEEAIVEIEWDELAGFDRKMNVRSDYYDNGALAYSQNFYTLFWAQTPAETAMTTFRLGKGGSAQTDTYGIGSRVAVFDLGAC